MRKFLALIGCLALLCAVCAPRAVAQSTAYDPNLAMYALTFAGAAYCYPNLIEDWSCMFCQNVSTFTVAQTSSDSSTMTFGYVGYDSQSQYIVVAFRGTIPESFSNWILDLDASKFSNYDSIPGAQVHSGFLDAYNSVAGPLKTAFNQLLAQYPGASVLFTGHSMGAAMANLAATDMMAVGGNGGSVMLVTFGSPRVGNQAYASFAENNFWISWRLVHAADIVPHVPTMWMGFWHTGYEVWYPGDSGSYTVCTGGQGPPGSEDPSCSDSLTFALSVSDHLHYLGIGISACPGPV